MNQDKIVKLLFRTLILVLFPLVYLGAVLLSEFIEKLLRRALKEKGRDTVMRLLSYKGLIGIFELIERRSRA
jgi:peptidoglycan/LPS O-acetylase OafA/YrhL